MHPNLDTPMQRLAFHDKLSQWLKQLGELRDGVLVLASVSYILGYVVWSVHAANHKLGQLPAIDSQYFVAGAVPLAAILISYWIGRRLVGVAKEWWLFDNRDVSGWRLLVRVWVIRLNRLSLIIMLALSFLDWSGIWRMSRFVLGLVMIVHLISNLPDTGGNRFSLLGNRMAKFFRVFFAYYISIAIPVIGVAWYIERVYPKLPQEFGGVAPRCGYIDVIADQLSVETRQAIISPEVIARSGTVLRTSKVEITFFGSSRILFQFRGEVYDIGTDHVRAVTRCEF